MGLCSDEAVALQDPPDRGGRRPATGLACEVIKDGLGAGVMTGAGQLVAQLEHVGDDVGASLMRTRPGSTRPRF